MSKKSRKHQKETVDQPVKDNRQASPKKATVKWHIIGLIIIIAVGFSLRYSYITSDIKTKINYYPRGIGVGGEHFLGYDGVRYDWIATNVCQGKGYGYKPNKPDGWRPPGYPFFLIAVYSLLGKDYFTVKFLQVLFSTLTIFLAYLITAEITGRKTALIAALICAVYYDAVIFPLLYYSEILFGFLMALILYLLLFFNRFDSKPVYFKYGYIILLGLISGFAVLVRPIFFPMLPFVCLGLGLTNGFSKKFFKKTAFYVLTVIIVLAPWSIRNSKLYHRPSFVSNNGGYNFSMGFCTNANGHFLPEFKRFTPEEKEIMKNKNALAIGKTFVKEHPMKALGLFLRKIYIQLFYKNSTGKAVVHFPGNPVPMLCYTPLIALLFIGGMFAGIFIRIKRLILPYSFIIGYILCGSLFFYMGDRQRIPMLVIYSLFAAIFLQFVYKTASKIYRASK